jgi:hypothetical protein
MAHCGRLLEQQLAHFIVIGSATINVLRRSSASGVAGKPSASSAYFGGAELLVSPW